MTKTKKGKNCTMKEKEKRPNPSRKKNKKIWKKIKKGNLTRKKMNVS